MSMKKVIICQLKLILFLTILVIFSSCFRSKGVITFNDLKHPVSTSAFLLDHNYALVMKGKDLDVLHVFEFKETSWSIFYGLIPLSQNGDMSIKLNEIIDQHNGDGIVNLQISIEEGAVNKMYSFLFMYLPGIIPVLPSSAGILLSGEVVKLSEKQ